MFGYVTANWKELTNEQMERYRAVYCGICRRIREQSGAMARLGLSYDMVFLALLLMSLYEPEETSGKDSCVLHPVKPRAWVDNEYVQYAADIVETQQQFPSQRFGILARLPVAQQQFQDLIIGHGQRLASQSLTQAAAVAAMGRGRGYRHCGHKVRCFLASARGRKEIHWGEPSSLLAMPVKLLRR